MVYSGGDKELDTTMQNISDTAPKRTKEVCICIKQLLAPPVD